MKFLDGRMVKNAKNQTNQTINQQLIQTHPIPKNPNI